MLCGDTGPSTADALALLLALAAGALASPSEAPDAGPPGVLAGLDLRCCSGAL